MTGYIGGDALTTIIEAHPDWQYTFFVRDSDKGAKVAARWPSVTLVYGKDWASAVNVLEEEAAKADVVLRKSRKPLWSSKQTSQSGRHTCCIPSQPYFGSGLVICTFMSSLSSKSSWIPTHQHLTLPLLIADATIPRQTSTPTLQKQHLPSSPVSHVPKHQNTTSTPPEPAYCATQTQIATATASPPLSSSTI